MSKICGYSCEHNKSGICQISVCDKKSNIQASTESYCYRKYKSSSNNSCAIKEKNIVGKNLLEGTYFDGNGIPKMIGITKAEYLEYKKLQQENKQLKDNWNKLREYFNERIEVCDNRLSSPFCNFEKATKERLIFSQRLEKLEELEQGSDK